MEGPACEGSHRWRRPWRGPPLQERPVPPRHPRRDLSPTQAPLNAYGIANTVCPGACAGEFLLGADGVLRLADGREWMAELRNTGFFCVWRDALKRTIRNVQSAENSGQRTAGRAQWPVASGQKKARATADKVHINSSIISSIPSKNRATHGGCPVF